MKGTKEESNNDLEEDEEEESDFEENDEQLVDEDENDEEFVIDKESMKDCLNYDRLKRQILREQSHSKSNFDPTGSKVKEFYHRYKDQNSIINDKFQQ